MEQVEISMLVGNVKLFLKKKNCYPLRKLVKYNAI